MPPGGERALKVKLRLFAGHRERAGQAQIELELPDGATVGAMANEVLRLYPAITSDPATLVAAVNQEYRDHDYVLSSGDEVALIPPVSGGAFPRSDHTEWRT